MCSYSATINSSLWPIGIRTWWMDTLSNNMTHLNVLNHEGKMRKSWHLIEQSRYISIQTFIFNISDWHRLTIIMGNKGRLNRANLDCPKSVAKGRQVIFQKNKRPFRKVLTCSTGSVQIKRVQARGLALTQNLNETKLN